MKLILRCVALAIVLGLANVALPAPLQAALRHAPAAQAQTCDAKPVVDTLNWTDGVTFTLRECAHGLFKVVATRIQLLSWEMEEKIAHEEDRVDLMGHWTIPTYKCRADGRPKMSCG